MSGVSDGVLQALARALQLDDAERTHLFDLARAAQPALDRPPRRRAGKQAVRPDLQWLLATITDAAAFVRNSRMDILAANELGQALYADMLTDAAHPPNTARFVFLDPRAQSFYREWAQSASECVAALRSAAGHDPFDRDLTDLVGELSTRSDEFRTRWAAHNVRFHDAALKRLHHPVVGELTLRFNRLELAADQGLALFTYAAEPGSRSEEALKLLGSWAATIDSTETAHSTDQSQR